MMGDTEWVKVDPGGLEVDPVTTVVAAGRAVCFGAPIARCLKNVFADLRSTVGRDTFPQLTDREVDVLDRLAAGPMWELIERVP